MGMNESLGTPRHSAHIDMGEISDGAKPSAQVLPDVTTATLGSHPLSDIAENRGGGPIIEVIFVDPSPNQPVSAISTTSHEVPVRDTNQDSAVIQRVETATTTQKIPGELSHLPTSATELASSCLDRKNVTDGIVLVPGAFAPFASNEERRAINGVFGLEMTSPTTGEPLARCGFDIEGDIMVINHTPQGAYKPSLSAEGRKDVCLLRDDFRGVLMDTMVEIARTLGLSEVVGISAENNPKVQFDLLEPGKSKEIGVKIINDVFEQAGFVRDGNLNYHRSLRK